MEQEGGIVEKCFYCDRAAEDLVNGLAKPDDAVDLWVCEDCWDSPIANFFLQGGNRRVEQEA